MHARTLLINVPGRRNGSRRLRGWPDRAAGWRRWKRTPSRRCVIPPDPGFARICEIFPVVFGRNGADHTIGRRVPELFRQAGLQDVGVEARVQIYPPGNSRRTIRLDLVRSMRAQVLDMGLASEAELDELDASARAHLDDSRTIAVYGLLFLAWGRKPA